MFGGATREKSITMKYLWSVILWLFSYGCYAAPDYSAYKAAEDIAACAGKMEVMGVTTQQSGVAAANAMHNLANGWRMAAFGSYIRSGFSVDDSVVVANGQYESEITRWVSQIELIQTLPVENRGEKMMQWLGDISSELNDCKEKYNDEIEELQFEARKSIQLGQD